MWHKAESNTRPNEVDAQTSKQYVYLHRNIVEDQRDVDGEAQTVYVYEELKVPKELYPILEQQQADIDYLTMMMEV